MNLIKEDNFFSELKEEIPLALKDEAHKIYISIQKKINQKQSIAIMGAFSAGKSTFLNRLLKTELPTSPIPTTALVTEIQYGDSTEFYICKNDKYTSITKKKFLELVNEKSSSNLKNIDYVMMKICHPLLKEMTLYDVPGLNSTHKHHTKIAHDIVKKTDDLLWITDQGKLEITQQEELEKICALRGKVTLVMNKLDSLIEDIASDMEDVDDLNEAIISEISKKMDYIQTKWSKYISQVCAVSSVDILEEDKYIFESLPNVGFEHIEQLLYTLSNDQHKKFVQYKPFYIEQLQSIFKQFTVIIINRIKQAKEIEKTSIHEQSAAKKAIDLQAKKLMGLYTEYEGIIGICEDTIDLEALLKKMKKSTIASRYPNFQELYTFYEKSTEMKKTIEQVQKNYDKAKLRGDIKKKEYNEQQRMCKKNSTKLQYEWKKQLKKNLPDSIRTQLINYQESIANAHKEGLVEIRQQITILDKTQEQLLTEKESLIDLHTTYKKLVNKLLEYQQYITIEELSKEQVLEEILQRFKILKGSIHQHLKEDNLLVETLASRVITRFYTNKEIVINEQLTDFQKTKRIFYINKYGKRSALSGSIAAFTIAGILLLVNKIEEHQQQASVDTIAEEYGDYENNNNDDNYSNDNNTYANEDDEFAGNDEEWTVITESGTYDNNVKKFILSEERIAYIPVYDAANLSTQVAVLSSSNTYAIYGETADAYKLANNKYVTKMDVRDASLSIYDVYHTPYDENSSLGIAYISNGLIFVRDDADGNAVAVTYKGNHYDVYEKKDGWYRISADTWITANSSFVTFKANEVSDEDESSEIVAIKDLPYTETAESVSDRDKGYLVFSDDSAEIVAYEDVNHQSAVSKLNTAYSYSVVGVTTSDYILSTGEYVSKSDISNNQGKLYTAYKSVSSTTNPIGEVYINYEDSIAVRNKPYIDGDIQGITYHGATLFVYEVDKKTGWYRVGYQSWITGSDTYTTYEEY